MKTKPLMIKVSFLTIAILLGQLMHGYSQVTFTRISTGSIVTDTARSFGCAWGDYDNDGYLDLIVGNGFGDANAVYNNNGDGTFNRITTNSIATTVGDSGGTVWGDYDNDGDLDLFISNWEIASYLFRNDGGGNFTRMSNTVIPLVPAPSNGCAWGDYDNDSFLDLIIANSGNDKNEHLFRNDGDGSFTRIFTPPVPSSGAFSAAPAWTDYDNDGRLDLSISPAGKLTESIMLLFHNEGSGLFSSVTNFPVVVNGEGGDSWGDYDNDGDLDLVGSGIGGSDTSAAIIFQNDGTGGFTRVVIDNISLPDNLNLVGGTFGDYDNDGWLDVVYGTSVTPGQSSINSMKLLYQNNGDGTFTRVTEGGIPNDLAITDGKAWVDYDNDGFLDLFLVNGFDTSQANFLYHNDGNDNHWLTIKCVGAASNRSGIGAKVRVKALIDGEQLWQLREINSGNGYNGSGLRTHFGLGDATIVDLVRIEWPSGTIQELHDLSVNQILTIKEPPAMEALGFAESGAFMLDLKGGRGFEYLVEYSTNLVDWSELSRLTATNINTSLVDPDASTSDTRFYRSREED